MGCMLFAVHKSLVLHTQETLITQSMHWNKVIISPLIQHQYKKKEIPTYPTFFWGGGGAGHVTGTRHISFYLALPTFISIYLCFRSLILYHSTTMVIATRHTELSHCGTTSPDDLFSSHRKADLYFVDT